MTRPLTARSFFTGFFSELALRGYTTVSIRNERFDQALGSVFKKLMELEEPLDLDVMFRIRPHSVHGDSVTVRNEITSAAQRDIISLDNPEYQDIRLKIGREEAETYLSEIPGGRNLFVTLADEFLEQFQVIRD